MKINRKERRCTASLSLPKSCKPLRSLSSRLLGLLKTVFNGSPSPSRNRTCDFPAHGSSTSLRLTVIKIYSNARFGYEIIPYLIELCPPDFPFLITMIQQPVCFFFEVFPEAAQAMQVTINPVVIAMPSYHRRQSFHRTNNRHVPLPAQP